MKKTTTTRELTYRAAVSLNYAPITYGYSAATDGAQLEAALELLRKGGIPHVVVRHSATNKPEIWRKISEIRGVSKEQLRKWYER